MQSFQQKILLMGVLTTLLAAHARAVEDACALNATSLKRGLGKNATLDMFQFDTSYLNLNHGSYGSVPLPVRDVRRCWSEVVESAPDKWYRFDMFPVMDNVRRQLSEYIGSESPNDVVFVDNASHGINAVLRSLASSLLRKSDSKVLYLQTAYQMVKNTLSFLDNVFHENLVLVNVSFPDSAISVDLDNAIVDAVEAALASTDGIKLAVVSHITSTPAAIYPVKRLTRLFHRYGVQVLVDGAHCLGQIPIDVRDIDSDYYVANGHKWLYSPKGSAILHVRPDRQSLIYPTTISYEGQGETRFQIGFSYQGTQDMSQFVTMLASLRFREALTGGNDTAIMAYMHDLAVRGGQLLAREWNTELLLPTDSFGAMVDVRVPCENDALMHDLPQTLLSQYSTYVPMYAWDNGGAYDTPKWYARVSAQIFNDIGDFEFFASAVKELLKGC